MRIGNRGDTGKRKLKPPPNYSSRSVQWRLLGLMALLMLVVTLATEARNPNRWKWLTSLDRLQQGDEEKIDPKLNPPPTRTEGDEVVVGQQKSTTASDTTEKAAEITPIDRAWRSGWDEVVGEISHHDRSVLYDLLRSARQKSRHETSAEASDTLDRVERAWSNYLDSAKAGLEGLPEAEKESWSGIVEQLEVRWNEEIKAALRLLVQSEELSDAQRSPLNSLQDLLDQISLSSVEDSTPWRAAERAIWFRLIEKLQGQSLLEAEAASQGQIGYAQLFKQPEVYRGKMVTVRGTVEAVYRLDVPENPLGLSHYWVYWIKPQGGPNSPIVVYALEKPEDFPSIEFAELGHKRMPRQEDVEFHGYFLKRYAYEGKGGLYTAPLILAKEPHWLQSSFISQRELPSLGTFLTVMLVLAALAALFAAWVYYQYRPGRPADSDLPAQISLK